MVAKRFEDLVAWQRARELTMQIYRATSDGPFARDFGLKDQIQRAATSIMSNIAEGFERYRPAEFHQFLSVAKGSCGEVRSQLYVAVDVGYIAAASFDELARLANETGRLIAGLRAAIERRRDSDNNL
jgi:four helix bundle protein